MSINDRGIPAMDRIATTDPTIGATRGLQIDPTRAVMNYGQNVRTPDMMSVTEATAPKSPLLDPNRFSFTNYGIMSGMQPEVLSKMIAMQEIYGRPVGVTSGFRTLEKNKAVDGADASQHLVGGAVDLMGALRNPTDTAALINAGLQAGFTGRGAYMQPGSVHLDIGPPRAWGPDYSSASIGSLPKAVQDALNQRVQAAAPAPVQKTAYDGSFSGFGLPEVPSSNIGNLIAGTQPMSYGVPASETSAFYGSMPSQYALENVASPSELASYMKSQSFNTGPRAETITQSTPTEIGKRINNLKAMASNPNLTAAQKAKLTSEVSALEAMGGIAFSPTSDVRPVPEGFVVDPKTGVVSKSPGYNVVAGPYAEVPSPIGIFENMSFAMPSKISLATQKTIPNPSYRQVPMDMQASLISSGANSVSPVLTQGPQSITPPGLNAPKNAVPSPSYVAQGNFAPDYYSSPAAPVQVAGSPSYAPQGNFAPDYYSAPYVAGVAPPVQVAQDPVPAPAPAPVTQIAKAPQVTQNIVANKMADAFRYRDDRDVGANRERNTTRKLLGLGYTQEQIAAMTPEEIREIIRGNTPPTATTPAATAPVVAANGGRIYKRDGGGNGGGTSRQSGDEESGGRSGKKTDNTPYEPISLPPMPQYQPYTLPQYTMPSASPLVANFMGSLSQPIPPVQMPQYQSMVSPLQNVAPSFANPAMGTSSSGPSSGAGFGFGVNAMRYNPMLMDERPDYALTTNDSISNALRLMRG
jgi:hypothetical protein